MTAPLWLFIAVCIPLAILVWEAASIGSSHLQADREQRDATNRAAKLDAMRRALCHEAREANREAALIELLAAEPEPIFWDYPVRQLEREGLLP
jgi:hypothetical protein